MSVQVENLEKNMAKLTIEVPAEKVEEALQAAYMKQKNRISVPGFRKGKVPRAMVENVWPGNLLRRCGKHLNAGKLSGCCKRKRT